MFKKIMVPLDGSELAECILPHVEVFIASSQVNTIVLVRVVDSGPTGFRSVAPGIEDLGTIIANLKRYDEERKSSAESYLTEVAGRLKAEGVKLQTAVLRGKVADSLIDYSETNDIDLIIIATHGRSGVSRWVRGSIADRILQTSKVPVLMVRAPGTMSEG